MGRKIKIGIGILSLILFLVASFFCGKLSKTTIILTENGIAQETGKKAESVKEIAVVNMDTGIQLEEKMVNYAAILLESGGQDLTITNLQDAKSGIRNGRYAAYLIFHADFSESVESVYRIPTKAKLTYEMNPFLDGPSVVRAFSRVKSFEAEMNRGLSKMYLEAVMDGFHAGQDSVKKILDIEEKELAELQDIHPEQALVQLDFIELSTDHVEMADLDISSEYDLIYRSMEELEEEYDRNYTEAAKRLQDVLLQMEGMLHEEEKLARAIYSISVVNSAEGGAVYAPSVSDFALGLIESLERLEDERIQLRENLERFTRRESLPQEREEDPNHSTWYERIYLTYTGDVERNQDRLRIWKEGLDYERLASPSDALPIPDSPNDPATPSNAQSIAFNEYRRERDFELYRNMRGMIYSEILNELLDMESIEPENSELFRERVHSVLVDDIRMRGIVATASDATPWTWQNTVPPSDNLSNEDQTQELTATPSDAQVYVREYLASMPSLQFSSESFDHVFADIAEYARVQINAIHNGENIDIQRFWDGLNGDLHGDLLKKEEEIKTEMEAKTEDLVNSMNGFHINLQEYRPIPDWNVQKGDSLSLQLSQGVRDISNKVERKEAEDEHALGEYLDAGNQVQYDTREELDRAYTGTSQNFVSMIDEIKKNRNENARETTNRLGEFQKLLPQTRNGSLHARDTYDLMAQPINMLDISRNESENIQPVTAAKSGIGPESETKNLSLSRLYSGIAILVFVNLALFVSGKRRRRK